jgi:transposase
MTQRTTQQDNNGNSSVLYLAFELSSNDWKLGFSIGHGQKTRIRTIESGDTVKLLEEIAAAKNRFKLHPECPVLSCYEAGRDGFWLHRFLIEKGIINVIVDSSSIEVNRRKRRAKTDRLDVNSLVTLLIRSTYEKKVFSTVRVPSVEEEDRRQSSRELATLDKEETRVRNRIRSLLITQGIKAKGRMDFSDEKLEKLRTWDNQPLPLGLRNRIKRAWAHLVSLKVQIREATHEREDGKKSAPDFGKIERLQHLRGINISAWPLVRELFGWRTFKNGKQLGSLTGLTPTPFQSGTSHGEQGISKAGITHVRRIAIELAWSWVRYQPKSKLTCWFNERFQKGGKKSRKVGIVALARKLIIELWRYLETGVVPEGAEFKATI